MFAAMFLIASVSTIWYLPPLAAVVSLVYYSSRFEETASILRRALRLFITIVLFMGAIFLLLWFLSYNL